MAFNPNVYNWIGKAISGDALGGLVSRFKQRKVSGIDPALEKRLQERDTWPKDQFADLYAAQKEADRPMYKRLADEMGVTGREVSLPVRMLGEFPRMATKVGYSLGRIPSVLKHRGEVGEEKGVDYPSYLPSISKDKIQTYFKELEGELESGETEIIGKQMQIKPGEALAKSMFNAMLDVALLGLVTQGIAGDKLGKPTKVSFKAKPKPEGLMGTDIPKAAKTEIGTPQVQQKTQGWVSPFKRQQTKDQFIKQIMKQDPRLTKEMASKQFAVYGTRGLDKGALLFGNEMQKASDMVIKNAKMQLNYRQPGLGKSLDKIDTSTIKSLDQLIESMEKAVGKKAVSNPAVMDTISNWVGSAKQALKAGTLSAVSTVPVARALGFDTLSSYLEFDASIPWIRHNFTIDERNQLLTIDKDLVKNLAQKEDKDTLQELIDLEKEEKITAKKFFKEFGYKLTHPFGISVAKAELPTEGAIADPANIDLYNESELTVEGENTYLKPGVPVRWDTTPDVTKPTLLPTIDNEVRFDQTEAESKFQTTVSVPERGFYGLKVRAGYSGGYQAQEIYRLKINNGWLGPIIPDQYQGEPAGPYEDTYYWNDHGTFYLQAGDNTLDFIGAAPLQEGEPNSVHFDTARLKKTTDDFSEPEPTYENQTLEWEGVGRDRSITIKWDVPPNIIDKIDNYKVFKRVKGGKTWKQIGISSLNPSQTGIKERKEGLIFSPKTAHVQSSPLKEGYQADLMGRFIDREIVFGKEGVGPAYEYKVVGFDAEGNRLTEESDIVEAYSPSRRSQTWQER